LATSREEKSRVPLGIDGFIDVDKCVYYKYPKF